MTKRFRTGAQWSFKTARFTIELEGRRCHNYQYDGDDPTNETQAKLDSGEYVAFDSTVFVYLDGEEIARNDLGGSVYGATEAHEFWTAHRDPDPANRNTLALKARNTVICHYFPDMVREACQVARDAVSNMKAPPRLRDLAA